MKLLVLGHRGMLGSSVVKVYHKCDVCTTEYRWPSEEFKNVIRNFDGDLVINCIGAIPQKTQDFTINYDLPQFIVENLSSNIKYIHPDTDCVFDGQINEGELYSKNQPANAIEEYGISKSSIMRFCDKPNLKIIRTSIIGVDTYNKSLLSWFLCQKECANGYTNHYWNGATTIQWAKTSKLIFEDWDNYDNITQVGTAPISKYDLLCLIRDAFDKQIKIVKTKHARDINRCLQSDFEIPHIKYQLNELREIHKNE